MNLFGFDIGELDLESFVAAMRLVTVAIVAISFLFFYRLERWRILAMGIGALVAVGWFTTFYPLYRVYGLEAPGDRLRNLSWVASVAAGNSPMSTGWVGDLSLEPFWALAAGTLCFGRPEWAPLVYAILSLLIPLLLGFVLFAHFRRDDEEGSGELLGLFVVTFVLLVSTDPLDYVAPFRGFFSRNFFLKPNHSVGYVLIPVLVGIVAGEKRGWVLRATALLCLLGWVFIIHWAFFCLGLGIYLLLRYVKGSSGWGRELGNTLVLWVVSAAAVAPYVYIIYAQYPYALRLDPVVSTQPPTLSYWGDMLPVGSSLLLLVTLDRALLFFFGLAGAGFWWRRGDKRDLLWLSLVVGAYLMWGVNYVGYLTSQARESDEFFHFLEFVLSVAAGVGAYRLFEAVTSRLSQWRPSQVSLVLVSVLVVTPLLVPYWREPSRMDGHFRLARKPLTEPVRELRDWVLESTEGTDVIVADGLAALWVPALTGRQMLVPHRKGKEYLDRLLSGPGGANALPFRVTHILYSHELEASTGLSREILETDPRYRRVFENQLVTAYRIEK